MPAAAGVWSKDHGLLWGAKKTRQQPGPEQPRPSPQPSEANEDPPNEPPPETIAHAPPANRNPPKPCQKTRTTHPLLRAVGLHPQPACHEPKTRDPPNEPQRPAKRTSPRKRRRHPPQQYGPNETRQTKPGNGGARRTTPETPDGTTHSLRWVCGSIQGYRLNYPLNGSRKRDLPRNGNARRKTAGTPDEPHTRFGGVLSEPTSRPATPPNTHTRERQPARQTESETREVNQPPKRRRRSPVPSTNRATAVQNKYHTPTSVVPHTRYGGRYHTPARVGWVCLFY
ncbi:hypothetical protein BS47DRAFT_1361781 [Hydnum rufescens UP504]|uniref:Uncharacterized protein n=1 Tax=Hydnum rufescens UP504 TaxID=1448309 RepID=A0A9P6B131_9AGAM|nr:hypothetical protein BS47DRAFT_1361781 [Hydnum rufescens UP504]